MSMTNNKTTPLTEEEIRRFIATELPRLISQSPEIRYELIGVMSEVFVKKDEMTAVLNELRQMREDFEKQWLELTQEIKALREVSDLHTQEIKALREDFKALREDFNELRTDFNELRTDFKVLRTDFNELRTDFKVLRADVFNELAKVKNVVFGLGARWGLMSEEAFRSGLAAVLTDELGFRVERYHGYDESGSVYGHPDQVELDVIIRNGWVIAIEIKSSISRGDLSLFQRKITFYEQSENRRVDEKFVISPFVDPAAAEMSERLGIELYTHSSEIAPF